MNSNALHILKLFGFEEIPPDRKQPEVTRWHYSKSCPDVLLELHEDATVHDVRDALVSYGARVETREQYKRFLLTFGASPTDANLPPFLLDPEGAPLLEPTSETENL
jgi:hypothetical protein